MLTQRLICPGSVKRREIHNNEWVVSTGLEALLHPIQDQVRWYFHSFVQQLHSCFHFGRFGDYRLVFPGTVSPVRPVPEHIKKPSYYKTGQPKVCPETIEIKSMEEIGQMRESCRLATRILKEVGKYIRVRNKR